MVPARSIAQKVSIHAKVQTLLAGRRLMLYGYTSSGLVGSQIGVRVLRRGLAAPRRIVTVVTVEGGRWSYIIKPQIDTTYSVRWGSGLSRSIEIVVKHPAAATERARG